MATLIRSWFVHATLGNVLTVDHRLLLAGEDDFLEAYEAEGLFSLCAVLVKILLTHWLVEHWASFAPTFEVRLERPPIGAAPPCRPAIPNSR